MPPVGDRFADAAAIAEAEETLRALAADYPGYAAAELDELSAGLGRLAEGERLDSDVLLLPAHNLKGQGASFGYDLITRLGEALCEGIRCCNDFAPNDISRLSGLVRACREVIARRLTGSGGAAGAALLARVGLVA